MHINDVHKKNYAQHKFVHIEIFMWHNSPICAPRPHKSSNDNIKHIRR
jgi:hypothetical protein